MSTLVAAGEAAHPEIFEQLKPAERDALTLAAAVHEGRDRDTWGGIHYWDQLVERIKLARIGGPNLADWWEHISQRMDVQLWPSNRVDVTRIITGNDPAVLDHLIGQTDYLVGAVLRLCVSAARETRSDQQEELPL